VPDLAALQAAHPEWHLVDAIDAPGGGIWALGADGGVFALGGAPFHGSYMGESAQTRIDPTRRFTLIQQVGNGYKLLTDRPWEAYNYGPQEVAAPGAPEGPKPEVAPPGAAPPGADPAEATVNAILKSLGLEELGTKAYAYWKSLAGAASTEDLNIWLQGQPEYETRFPGMKHLADQGLAWTPAQYITAERTVRGNLHAAGLPDSFFDSHEDFGDFLKKGWSPDEINDAIAQAGAAVHTMSPETRAAFSRWENANGVTLTDGELTALWLDPDVALPIIEARAKAAATAGTATRIGFTSTFGGELTEAEATRLTQAGAGAEALAGVTRLAPLFSETAEETQDFGRTEALGAAAGEGPAEEALRRRRAARQARFEGGGGAAGVGGKTSGLGTAT
jgi:hypothetical protein